MLSQEELLKNVGAGGAFDINIDIRGNKVSLDVTYGNGYVEMELVVTCSPLRYVDVRCISDCKDDRDYILDAYIHKTSDLLDRYLRGEMDTNFGAFAAQEEQDSLRHLEIVGPTCVNVICKYVSITYNVTKDGPTVAPLSSAQE